MDSGIVHSTGHRTLPVAADRWTTLAACSVAVLAGLVLVGWVLGIEPLKRVLPGLVAMNPTTAVTFLLAGLALWLLRDETTTKLKRTAGLGAAAVVLAVGLLRLSVLITGSGPAVDQWLLPTGAVEPTGVPSSMAPNTALLFILTGASLLLMGSRLARRVLMGEVLALIALAASMLALIGYLYGVGRLYGVAAFIPMALPTATAFMLLVSGLLAARPRGPVMALVVSRRAGGMVIRRVMPGAVVIVLVLGLLRLKGQEAGLFEIELGVSLMSAGTILLMAGLVVYIARVLDRLDIKREQAAEELRLSESRLRASNELLAAILENIGDGIVLADGAGRTLMKNPAAERLLGSIGDGPCLQWTGGGVLCTPDRAGAFPAAELAMGRAAGGEHVAEQEQFLKFAEGDGGRWLAVSAQPVVTPSGQGAVIAMRDITSRKLIELRLEDENDLLESLVASRTADLTRSNQDLQQFAYVASHDLQEPLRMVGSYLQLLERRYKDRLDDEAREFIGYAVDGANRMKQLINDLLQYSRVDRKGGNVVPTDPRGALDDALHALSAVITESGAEITATPLPQVAADPAQLRQLFQNLVGNAIKFRTEAGPRVEISAERDAEGWRFTVADNGIGIEPQYADRIFDVFQRLHSREEYAGTGIGLAICKKIVDRHGGRIWVEPAEGGGSRFNFTIPDKQGVHHEHRIAA
ncbi:MAG: PAS domain-containing protein [Phycisphaeraceae bacterium]|nr:PAS domain-containing protein [Phycisphaeraceae bacterium]